MVRAVIMTLGERLRMLRFSMAMEIKVISPLIAVETQLFPIVVMRDTFIPNSLYYRSIESGSIV
jgi:hypothetical protein